MFKSEKGRFYLEDDNNKMIAEITYEYLNDHVIDVDHTFVDSSLRGQGIARKLVDEVVLMARKDNLKIKPTCPYVVRVFENDTTIDDVLYKL